RPQLRHIVAACVSHPDICTVKSDHFGIGADGERPLQRAVAGPQFCHSAALIRHPDVQAIKSETDGAAGTDTKRAGPNATAVARAQFCNGVVCIRHPDICAVKRDSQWVSTYRKCALDRAVAYTKFYNRIVGLARHPDISAVKGYSKRIWSDGDV